MNLIVRTFVFAVAALTLAATTAQAQRGGRGDVQGGPGSGQFRPPGGGQGHTIPGGGREHGGGYDGGYGRGGGGWHRGPVYGGGTVYYPGQYPGRTCGWDYSCGDTYVGGTVACSPKTFEGNVTATDRVLKTLVSSKDFASASSFKAQVSKISAMSDAAAKATAYLNLAGINSNDNAAIVSFVGARDAKGSWITDLQRNADLSNAQAEVVASKLQTALRGGLQ